jgi:hypothetical protein
MAKRVVRVFSRPDITHPWFYTTWTPEMVGYIQLNYRSPGLRVGELTESADGLTLTEAHVYASPEAETAFYADPYIASLKVIKDNYLATQEIILVSETSTIVPT